MISWENKKSSVQEDTHLGDFPDLLTCESSEGLFLNKTSIYTGSQDLSDGRSSKIFRWGTAELSSRWGNRAMSGSIRWAWENVMLVMLHSSSEEVRAESQLDPAIPLGCNCSRSNCVYANGIARKVNLVGDFNRAVVPRKGCKTYSQKSDKTNLNPLQSQSKWKQRFKNCSADTWSLHHVGHVNLWVTA